MYADAFASKLVHELAVASVRTGHQRESEVASTAGVRGPNVIWQQSFVSILLEPYRVYGEFRWILTHLNALAGNAV